MLDSGRIVTVFFKTKGTDNKPFKYKATAEVIKHHQNGWATLKMDKTKQTQTYRIHLSYPKRGVYSNYRKEAIYIIIFPTEKVMSQIATNIYKQLEIN